MKKIDINYILHCVKNARILLTQNELLKVDGLLHSAQMCLEKNISTTTQQLLYGSAYDKQELCTCKILNIHKDKTYDVEVNEHCPKQGSS